MRLDDFNISSIKTANLALRGLDKKSAELENDELSALRIVCLKRWGICILYEQQSLSDAARILILYDLLHLAFQWKLLK